MGTIPACALEARREGAKEIGRAESAATAEKEGEKEDGEEGCRDLLKNSASIGVLERSRSYCC